MVEAQEIKPCLFCDSATDMFVHEKGEAKWVQCKCCCAEGGVGKTRKEAIDIWNKPWKLGVKPLPCLRDQNGDVREQPVKAFFAKVDEELNELKEAVLYIADSTCKAKDVSGETDLAAWIAEEAADTVTAITTMLEALGIDADMRAKAQMCVNEKNRSRGRL